MLSSGFLWGRAAAEVSMKRRSCHLQPRGAFGRKVVLGQSPEIRTSCDANPEAMLINIGMKIALGGFMLAKGQPDKDIRTNI